MPSEAADPRLETVELAAVRDLFAAAPESAVAALGIAARDVGDALCSAVAALPGARTFNRVAGLGLASEVGAAELEAIERFYADHGLEYVISVAPETCPADLGERLLARGYEADYPWVKFARGVDRAEQVGTDLLIERAGPEHAEGFGRAVAGGFGLPDAMVPWTAALVGRPGWCCHVALDGDKAVGAGALYVADTTGWLGLGATLPEHRGRGAQNAILHARIAAAAEAGCDTVVTETGAALDGTPSNSYRNILRQGFDAVYERPNLRGPRTGGPNA